MATMRTNEISERYDFHGIEQRWQRLWEERGTFHAPDASGAPKLYVLQMFPYPSGDLHAGHVRNYVLGDAIARYYRMHGYNVTHPMGFDSFGLPAEQAAIDRGIQPRDWIATCVNNSRRQFMRYGFSFDWQREVVTSEPEYYSWTQWLFAKFHELGLVYRKEVEVNWCEVHGVLANDEVKEGGCWRCDRAVVKKKLAQWLMRTTDFAEDLLAGLDRLPGWNDAVRTMQRNWIGRSEGTNMDFAVPAVGGVLTVFTTRVDTIFGCTFMAVAPDHPLAAAMAAAGGTAGELEQFKDECAREAVEFGVAEDKPKRGLRLGVDCVNPFNGEPVPVFATNYVVSDFGTGAVMAVPAHDTRDYAFAKEYGLPVKQVIAPAGESDPGSTAVPGRGSATGNQGLKITRRNLPHWKLDGSVYFITWRLRPELPELTPQARTIIADAIRHFDDDRYKLYGYVIMNDHVHVMVCPGVGQEVSALMHSWRSFTANRLQRECGYEGAIWQDDYFDRIVRDEDEFWLAMEYIVSNPSKRWSDVEEYEWVYWTAPGSRGSATGNQEHGQGRPRSGEIACFTDKGVCINSGEFDGLEFPAAKAAMDAWLAQRGLGGATVQYRLRDWNMSRQRFWGAPIPMVHCDKPEEHGGCGWQRVPEAELPVLLPERADYSDIKVSPLANDRNWQRARCPQCGGPATRETDTMTTFMDSAWYFLRYCDPHNEHAIFDPALVQAWLPVDYYVGGKEHAVGHLLYSRFITHVLHRAGLIDLQRPGRGDDRALHNEPFRRLFNQGIVHKDGAKMSKSKGNVVSSDELAETYGADTARLFSFFGGPYDQDLEWSKAGVDGCHRFLKRVWRLAYQVAQAQSAKGEQYGQHDRGSQQAVRARHRAVAGVTADIEAWRFNTAIAKLMECLNELEELWRKDDGVDDGGAYHVAMQSMAQLLCPFAPHIAEEIWQLLGGYGLCCDSDWPEYDAAALAEDTVEYPVQVNGKLRGKVTVPADAGADVVLSAAKADTAVAKWLEGKELAKEIVVPGRMVTFVVK